MTRTIEIPIKGMTCAACAAAVQRALSRVKGVENAQVNLLTEKATITVTEDVKVRQLISIVRATGYDIGKTSLYLQVHEIDQDSARLIEEKISQIEGVIEVKPDIVNKIFLFLISQQLLLKTKFYLILKLLA